MRGQAAPAAETKVGGGPDCWPLDAETGPLRQSKPPTTQAAAPFYNFFMFTFIK